MLTTVVKATRAHNAALKHRQGPGRTRLKYTVTDGSAVITSGCVWVRVGECGTYTQAYKNGRRRAEITRLMNRLRSMYPEYLRPSFACWFE